MRMIEKAIKAGRVDAIIQSTDKNFLTPVGGAIIASPNKNLIQSTSEVYPGRANAAPILHFVVSMLSMGLDGFQMELEKQVTNRIILQSEIEKLASDLKENVLEVNNPVACMMTLNNLTNEQISKLGGYLYNSRVTGPRVVNPKTTKFGPSSNNYPYSYIVINAAIGAQREDILGAIARLRGEYTKIQNRSS
jgi:O-phospho-L-seryl-tRNASec:L-selenocysteinyl-tRNA synthase